MTLERLGRCEFAELVSNHGLIDKHRHVLPAVVNGESVTNEIRKDRGTTGPGLDDLLGPLFVLSIYLVEEVLVYKRAFL